MEELKYDLSSIILEPLQSLYQLENLSDLYNYLNLRFAIHYGSKNFTERELLEFILSELNITSENNKAVSYKGSLYPLNEWQGDFFDNFKFRASIEGQIDYEKKYSKILAKGTAKARKYKDLKEYQDYLKYFRLKVLNEEYNCTPNSSSGVEGFEFSSNHNPFKRTLEESLESILDASRFMGSNTTSHITEEDLEDYLVKNLNLIEDGLTLINRQVRVSGGIIDILARDSSGVLCVLELKIKEDKSLLWQTLHYPPAIKEKHRENKVRMLVIAPEFREHMKSTLLKNPDVELYRYIIKVKLKEIENMKIHKII